MTPVELVRARERLGLTVEALAADLALTPAVVEAWESGRIRAPGRVTQTLAWRVAAADRDVALAASGLPECAELERLGAEFHAALARREMGVTMETAIDRVTEHTKTCPLCRERAAYVDAHAPPLPPMPRSPSTRAIEAVIALPDRLPASLRPPPGERGSGRRTGLFVATALAAWSVALFMIVTISRGVRGHLSTDVAGDLLSLPEIVVGYFIGFYLAGALVDATRPLRRRLIGYVLRGGGGTGLVYGTLGIVVELRRDEGSIQSGLTMALVLAGVGALAGALLWLIDRARGRLPPAAD